MTREEQLAQALRECMGIVERLVWLADVAEDDDGCLRLQTDSLLVTDAREVLAHTKLVYALKQRDDDITDLVGMCRDIAMAPWRRAR